MGRGPSPEATRYGEADSARLERSLQVDLRPPASAAVPLGERGHEHG